MEQLKVDYADHIEQTIPLTHLIPKLHTGIINYYKQLNFHNLGIHVGSTGKGVLNVWTEHEAGRGTQEVESFLKEIHNAKYAAKCQSSNT